jgi:hypothetical protein
MLLKCVRSGPGGTRVRRRATACVEFAFTMPLLLILMSGLWEIGRITEVSGVMWNSAREAARDASLGQDNLSTVATNLLSYLQSAEPNAFPSGHSTSMISPVITLPANTTGYTCWDNTAGKELFTITFKDFTNTSITDPTLMLQLDRYEIGVQVPYSSISWSPIAQITGVSRIAVAIDWVSMVDSPFSIPTALPAQ